MNVQAWRIVMKAQLPSAFSGEGARLFGGRWNLVGVPAVYTASSRALAALEMLAHLSTYRVDMGFVFVGVRFDAALMEAVTPSSLPADWQRHPPPRSTQVLGSEWIMRQGASAVLRTPSAIIPEEWNYVLNPRHRDFAAIQTCPPEPFSFDLRLLPRGSLA